MFDTDLYARILGVEQPWQLRSVELRLDDGEVEVLVDYGGEGRLSCPECGAASSRWPTYPNGVTTYAYDLGPACILSVSVSARHFPR